MIYRDPLPSFRSLFHPVNSIQSRPDAEFLGSARYALGEGLRRIGLQPGDGVVVPAYICHEALETIREHGIRIQFCEVEPDLRMNTNHILQAADRSTRALLSVYYFGLRSDHTEYRSLCRQQKWHLVEDNAHTLYCGKVKVDSDTACAVFGLRKFLPVPTGAVLWMNDRGKTPRHESFIARCATDLRYIGRSVLKKAYTTLYKNDGTRLLLHRKERVKENSSALPRRSDLPYHMTPLSLRTWDCASVEEVAKKRRFNLALLTGYLAPKTRPWLTIVYGQLDENACPFVMPVRVLEKAENFVEYLLGRGIESYLWPALPEEVAGNPSYSQANALAASMVLLPIHQDISENVLDEMAKIILSWNPGL